VQVGEVVSTMEEPQTAGLVGPRRRLMGSNMGEDDGRCLSAETLKEGPRDIQKVEVFELCGLRRSRWRSEALGVPGEYGVDRDLAVGADLDTA